MAKEKYGFAKRMLDIAIAIPEFVGGTLALLSTPILLAGALASVTVNPALSVYLFSLTGASAGIIEGVASVGTATVGWVGVGDSIRRVAKAVSLEMQSAH